MFTARVLVALLMATCVCSSVSLRAADDDDVKNEAIGAYSGALMLQTYFNVGLMADLSAKNDADDKETLNSMLPSVESILHETQKHTDALLKTNMTDEDKAALKKFKVCYALLDEQISALKAFWKDRSDKNATAFDEARKAAWKKISETLDIKD